MNSFNDSNTWVITAEDRSKYDNQFYSLNPVAGFLSGEQAKFFFLKSGLPTQVLGMIWHLSDINMDGKMDKNEFSISMHLIKRCLKGFDLPPSLPPSLLSSLQLPSGLMLSNQSLHHVASSAQSNYNTLPHHSITNQASKQNLFSPSSTVGRNSISQNDWMITPAQRLKYKAVFDTYDTTHKSYLTGLEAKGALSQSGLTHTVLAKIWCLADHDADGNLSLDEFCVAMHLIDQAKSGFVLPVTLPPELVPPSQRKMRRTSEVSALPAASSISSFNTGVISNNKSSSRVVTPGVDSNSSKGEDSTEPELPRIVTFEDKRKENFNQGQAELEKRRAMLKKLQMQETEARFAAEREEFEKKEKLRLEQEMKKQQEFEKQLEKQKQTEMEKEEERKRMLEQKQAARQELNRQRQSEWLKQRQEQLIAERSKFQTAVDELKQQTGQQKLKLESLRQKKADTKMRGEETRQKLSEMSSIIDSIKLLSLSKCTEIDVITSELEEVEMKKVAVEQESLRLKKQFDTSEVDRDDSWRLLRDEKNNKKELLLESKKKLEIVGLSCAKKEEVIKEMMSEQQTKDNQSSTTSKPTSNFDNFFEGAETTQVSWQPDNKQIDAFNITNSGNAWVDVSSSHESKNDFWSSNTSEPKSSWVANFQDFPGTMKRYKALYNFEARTHDELTLLEGQIVTVDSEGQKNAEPGWMIGSKDGQTGCFPESYVALVQEEGKQSDGFSTLSKAFEEAFSKKSASSENSKKDDSSLQPFQALNDAFTTVFGAANVTSTSALDQASAFNNDFSTLTFDKTNFDGGGFDFGSSAVSSTSFESAFNDVKKEESLPITSTHNNLSSKPTSSIENAIKDILQKSRMTPISPIPFANSAALKSHSPSPLTQAQKNTSTQQTTKSFDTTSLTNNIFPDDAVKDIKNNNLFTDSNTEASKTPAKTAIKAANTSLAVPQKLDIAAKVQAVYAWQAKKANHLTFAKGDVITKLSEQNTWYYGEFNGEKGWFPKSYVKNLGTSDSPFPENPPEVKSEVFETNGHTLSPPTSHINQSSLPNKQQLNINDSDKTPIEEFLVVGMFNYDSDVKGDLTFKKGEVFMAQASDVDWWTGSHDDGRTGIFPSSYVKKLETVSSGKLEKKPEIAVAIADYEATGPEQLSFKTDQLIHIRKKSKSGWWEGEIQVKGQKRRAGWIPANYVKIVGGDENVLTNQPSTHNNTSDNTEHHADAESNEVVALFSYTGQAEGDLNFVEGDKIKVTQKCSDDWWEGELDGKVGIFPANYVSSKKYSCLN